MDISNKAELMYRSLIIILFIVFLATFYQYSQNGRYRYTKMSGYNAYVIDSRTGEVFQGIVSIEKYNAYKQQLEAANAAAQAEARTEAWAKVMGTMPSYYDNAKTFTSDDLRQMALKVAQYYGVPKDLLLGITATASDWNPVAKNPTNGALGLEQFTDDKAKNYFREPLTGDVNDPRWHPGYSIDAAARYLIALYDKYGNWPEAVMHYGDNTPAYLQRVKREAAREANLLLNSKKGK
jgi:soluble lytic murein transglycosylase-like protein